jgi:hypothetical protein
VLNRPMSEVFPKHMYVSESEAKYFQEERRDVQLFHWCLTKSSVGYGERERRSICRRTPLPSVSASGGVVTPSALHTTRISILGAFSPFWLQKNNEHDYQEHDNPLNTFRSPSVLMCEYLHLLLNPLQACHLFSWQIPVLA